MDTTETYIKMCEKAEEIQLEYWDPELLGYEDLQDFYAGDEDTVYRGEHRIWLPRQDQLQEMFNDNINYTIQIQGFGEILEFYGCQSWEQLWLAFVMKEKYNKTWNGEEWVERL